jgi:hypothetical protein
MAHLGRKGLYFTFKWKFSSKTRLNLTGVTGLFLEQMSLHAKIECVLQFSRFLAQKKRLSEPYFLHRTSSETEIP